MLILTRRCGEELQIGDDVRVAILEVRPGGSVRVGVRAPREVKVIRTELIERDEVGADAAVLGAEPV